MKKILVLILMCSCIALFGCSMDTYSQVQYSCLGVMIPSQLADNVYGSDLWRDAASTHSVILDIQQINLDNGRFVLSGYIQNGKSLYLDGSAMVSPNIQRRLISIQLKEKNKAYEVLRCFVKDYGTYEGTLLDRSFAESEFVLHLQDKEGNLYLFEVPLANLPQQTQESFSSFAQTAEQPLLPSYNLFHMPDFIEVNDSKNTYIVRPNNGKFNLILGELENSIQIPVDQLDHKLSIDEINQWTHDPITCRLFYHNEVSTEYALQQSKENVTYTQLLFSLEHKMIAPYLKNCGWNTPIGPLMVSNHLLDLLRQP